MDTINSLPVNTQVMKQPYSSPSITEYGSIMELTQASNTGPLDGVTFGGFPLKSYAA